MGGVILTNILQELEIILGPSKEKYFPALSHPYKGLCSLPASQPGSLGLDSIWVCNIPFYLCLYLMLVQVTGGGFEHEPPLPSPPSTTPSSSDASIPQTSNNQHPLDSRKCPTRKKRCRLQIRAIIPTQVVEPVLGEGVKDGQQNEGWGTASIIWLGYKPRSFIQHLAGQCDTLILPDLAETIKSGVQACNHLPTTLAEMNNHWKVSRTNQCFTQFWKSVLETLISIHCDM